MSHHLILHRFARTDEKADIHVVRRSRLVAGAPTTSPLSRKPPCSGGAGWRGVSPSLDARTDRARRRVTVNLRDACRRRCPALKRSAFAPLQVLVSEHSLSSVNRSVGIHGQPWPKVSRPVRPQRARQLKSPEPPARGSPRDLAIGIDAGGPVRSVSDRGGLRLSRADSGPQALPPARATVPPWPHASTVIQWRQPSARAWLRLDWFASADADVTNAYKT